MTLPAAGALILRSHRDAQGKPQSPPATTSDVFAVRLAQAVELNETGQCDLALATLTSIADAAPSAERRIEALCLAAEAELEAAQYAASSSHLVQARGILRQHADQVDGDVAREEVDFVEWLLRWRTGVACGFASPSPVVLSRSRAADLSPDERRRALFVRASAAYAMQRWEIGDRLGRDAVLRALETLRSLRTIRTREQLAIMDADVQFLALCAPPGVARDRFRRVEEAAACRGHLRAKLGARAERMACDVATRSPRRSFVDRVLQPFGSSEQRMMPHTYARVVRIAAQHEYPGPRALAAARLVEGLVPEGSAQALMARCVRVACALRSGRLDEARTLACAIGNDAKTVGNQRMRGAAIGYLAEIAFAGHRLREAQEHVRHALQLLEQHGTYESLKRAAALARTLKIA